MNKNNFNKPDERQEQIANRAFANVGIFLFGVTLFMMFYKMFTTDSMPWEFWAIIGSALIIVITNKVMGNVEEPKSFMGKPLPLGNTKEDKKARRLAYLLEALTYSIGITVLDILAFVFAGEDTLDFEFFQELFSSVGKTGVVIISALFTFTLTLTIAYSFEYALGRYKVNRYNKMLAELDSDDDI